MVKIVCQVEVELDYYVQFEVNCLQFDVIVFDVISCVICWVSWIFLVVVLVNYIELGNLILCVVCEWFKVLIFSLILNLCIVW